jgi:uncharacterized protein YkwD
MTRLRRHLRLRRRLALLGLAALLACGMTLATAPSASAARVCAAASAKPRQAPKRTFRRTTVCLLNGIRRAHGLRPLRISRRLTRAARRHAGDMVRRRYFSHWSLSGASFLDRIRRTGYLRRARRWIAGENLAWGTGRRGSPRAIVRAWMRSPGHRHNILTRRYREIGTGVAFRAPSGRWYPAATYAAEFGGRH